MISFKPIILSAVIIFFLSSCASIVSKTNWPLTVKSTPTGASVVITNRAGKEVYKGTTPASMKLKSGAKFFKRESYKVKLELAGYSIKEIPLECKINGWYWGNIVFGGAIGFLIVDPASGAMYKLDTPVIIETLSQTTGSNDNEREFRILGLNEIPEDLKGQLIKIN